MWQTFPVECGGGLITNLPPIQQGTQAVGTARRLVNFEASVSGGYARINGYSKWDEAPVPQSSSGQILGVAFFDGEVIAVREDKIHSSEGAGWTELVNSRTHNSKHRFTVFNFNGTRKLLGVDGENPPYVYDGSTLSEVVAADVDGASFVTDFKNHMFYAVDDLLVFSIPFDETDFTPASGAGTVRLPGDITGLIVFREQLFVFTSSTISALSGSSVSDFVLTSVATDIGCVAPDTIQEVAGDVVFLGPDGLRLLGSTEKIGDFNNLVITKPIQGDITDFRRSYNSFCSTVIRDKSQYRIMGWTADRLRETVEGYIGVQFEAQNPNSFAWSETRGIKAFSSDSKIWGNREYIIFSGEGDYVYLLDEGSDFDGEPIDASYWTPFFTMEDPSLRKTIYTVSLYLTPTSIVDGKLNLTFDLGRLERIQPGQIGFQIGGNTSIFGDAVYGVSKFSEETDTRFRTQVVGSGKSVSLQFEFSAISDKFNIDTLLIEYSLEGRY